MTHTYLLKTARLALAGLLLLATPAMALPVALPVHVQQDVQTPLGGIQADTNGPTCAQVATPGLPVPLPVPLPVNPQAGAGACVEAGADGIAADATADAAGLAKAEAHADAAVPDEADGFLEQLFDMLFGWF